MDLTRINERTHYNDYWNELFDYYVNHCKPEKKAKAHFAQQLGFLNYNQIKKELGAYWSSSNIQKIKEVISSLSNDKLTQKSEELAFRLVENPTLENCLTYLNRVGILNQQDYDDFIENGISHQSPVSLRNTIEAEFARQDIFNIKLNRREAIYFIKQHWSSLNKKSKIHAAKSKTIIRKCEQDTLGLISTDIAKIFNNMNALDKDTQDALINCFKRLVELRIQSPERLYSTVRYKFCSLNKWSDHDSSYINFCLSIGAASESEEEAIKFYLAHCIPHALNITPNKDMLGFTTSHDTRDNTILKILRNKSNIAIPVLASYLLHSLADKDMDIERFMACMYVIQKEPSLKPLCNKILPLKSILSNNASANQDLDNELIARFTLARVAAKFDDNKTEYIRLLEKLAASKSRYLVLIESCRMIESGAAKTDIFTAKSLFKMIYTTSTYNDFSKLTKLEVKAVIIICRLMNLPIGDIAAFCTNSFLNSSRELLNTEFSKLRRKNFEGEAFRNQVKNTLRRYNIETEKFISQDEYNNSILFYKSLNVSGNISETVENEIPCNNCLLKAIKFDSYHGHSFELTIDQDNLAKKHKSALDNLVNGNYRPHTTDENLLFALNFMITNKISTKKSVVKDSRCHSIIHDDTTHMFGFDDIGNVIKTLEDGRAQHVKIHIVRKTNYKIEYTDQYYSQGTAKELSFDYVTIGICDAKIKTIESIKQYYELVEKLQLESFNAHNPVTDIANRLSPQFYFQNLLINPKGTSYFE